MDDAEAAPDRTGCDREQNVIGKQQRFTRYDLELSAESDLPRAPCVQYQRAANHNSQENKNENASFGINGERVN